MFWRPDAPANVKIVLIVSNKWTSHNLAIYGHFETLLNSESTPSTDCGFKYFDF